MSKKNWRIHTARSITIRFVAVLLLLLPTKSCKVEEGVASGIKDPSNDRVLCTDIDLILTGKYQT